MLAKKIVSKEKRAGATDRQLAIAVVDVVDVDKGTNDEPTEDDETPKYTLVNPPVSRTSGWWKYFKMFHALKHPEMKYRACCDVTMKESI